MLPELTRARWLQLLLLQVGLRLNCLLPGQEHWEDRMLVQERKVGRAGEQAVGPGLRIESRPGAVRGLGRLVPVSIDPAPRWHRGVGRPRRAAPPCASGGHQGTQGAPRGMLPPPAGEAMGAADSTSWRRSLLPRRSGERKGQLHLGRSSARGPGPRKRKRKDRRVCVLRCLGSRRSRLEPRGDEE